MALPDGRVFRKESQRIQIFARDGTNSYIILTKDRLVPKSKGGANALSNYQVMRGPCHWAKGNKDT